MTARQSCKYSFPGSWIPHVLSFGVPEWETGSRSMFLVIQGWKWCSNAMAVCAITTVKTVVSEGFHFFNFFTKLVSRGWF